VTFGGNTSPRRRVPPNPTQWHCVCVVAGEPKTNPPYLMRCLFCGMKRSTV